MKKTYPLILAMVLFFSCQTEIDVSIPTYYNKLVVEGYIENDQYPMVSLYRSVPYFSTMSLSLEYLMDSIIIQDAKVSVTTSKGDKHDLFLSFSLQAPLLFVYTTNAFKGEVNTSYSLQIEWNDKVYTSETAILNTFDLDSVKFVPNFGHTEIDSIANLRIWMTDDGKPNNYYQFMVKKSYVFNDKPFSDRLWVSTIPAAFDNSPFRGIGFNYEIIRGSPSPFFLPPDMDEQERRRYFRMDYRLGDTVYLKYARLEESAYRFWQSAGGEITFGQNPFMSPTPIISNIKCNTGEKCLGAWCGSAAKEVVLIFDSTTSKASCSTLGFR